MTQEIKIGDKVYIVKEPLATEFDDIDWKDGKAVQKKQVMSSTGMSEEEYNNLTLLQRFALLKAFNEVNDLTGFQEGLTKAPNQD